MKPNLLIVDDDYSVRDSLRKLLESEGYDAFPARDGVEALDLFNSHPIDLVVLDINLGNDDGWEVFEAMADGKPFVPVIVITAEWGQRDKAEMLGADALIEKPIDVPIFLETIRELLDETAESKRSRVRRDDIHCRYAGRHYEPYLRLLEERRNAPFKIESLPAGFGSTNADANTQTVMPTVIGTLLNHTKCEADARKRSAKERERNERNN
jgi:Response regulator containing CheY-like receiver, AAA-type ATPase, and DNA-binding domains